MKNAHKRWALGASLLLVAGIGLALAAPATASAAPATASAATPQLPKACGLPSRSGHIAGIMPAVSSKCPASSANRITRDTTGVHITSDPANGTPPLLY